MSNPNDVIDAIGNTPLIKLRRASELTGCTILGKAEFMNPGPVGEGPRRTADHSGGREARRSSPAAWSSKAPPAIPASASLSSPMRAATAP
jgi:hypothetical protein